MALVAEPVRGGPRGAVGVAEANERRVGRGRFGISLARTRARRRVPAGRCPTRRVGACARRLRKRVAPTTTGARPRGSRGRFRARRPRDCRRGRRPRPRRAHVRRVGRCDRAAGREVPEAGGAVGGGRGQQAAVGAELGREQASGVAGQRATAWPPGARVEHPCPSLVVVAEQRPPVARAATQPPASARRCLRRVRHGTRRPPRPRSRLRPTSAASAHATGAAPSATSLCSDSAAPSSASASSHEFSRSARCGA